MFRFTVVSALVLLAVAIGPPAPSTWWVSVGLTSDQLQQRTDSMHARGYRPIGISAYNVAQANRFAVLYQKGTEPAWEMHWGQTPEQFLQRNRELGDKGYVPVCLSGSNLLGSERLSALWVRGEGRDVSFGLGSEELLAEINRMRTRGYRPARISSYMADTFTRYAIVWQKDDGVLWELHYGKTAEGFQDTLNAMTARGYRPVSASGLETVGVLRYCAIWEKRQGPAWQMRYGQSEDDFLGLINVMSERGYRPTAVTAYDTGSASRFVSIWEKDSPGRCESEKAATDEHGSNTDENKKAAGDSAPAAFFC
jgi:hypothetical protein